MGSITHPEAVKRCPGSALLVSFTGQDPCDLEKHIPDIKRAAPHFIESTESKQI